MAWKAEKKWIQQQFPWIQLSPLRQSVSIQSYTKSILQSPRDQHQKMRVPESTPSCLEKCKFRETVSVHAGPSLLVTTAIPLSLHPTVISRQVPEEIPKPSGARKGSRPKAEVGVEGPQQGTWLWLLYPRTPPPAQTLQAALGSPLPAYRMLFPNIAVHRYGTVLISMPWASMFSAAIRPGREKQQNKRGSSVPGQALWSALGSQHSIDIFSPRVQGNQDLLLSLKKKKTHTATSTNKETHRISRGWARTPPRREGSRSHQGLQACSRKGENGLSSAACAWASPVA